MSEENSEQNNFVEKKTRLTEVKKKSFLCQRNEVISMDEWKITVQIFCKEE